MDSLISRQAAIDAMINYFARWAEYTAWSKTVKSMVETAQEAAREMLTELPSAQPDKTYEQGWKDGREALRKEIWEDGRDRLN